MPYRMKTLLFCCRGSPKFSSRRAPTAIHTLVAMSSAAAAADVPEEFAALAEYSVDDFMSEAASDVEVFATTEGHGDVSAEEIRFLPVPIEYSKPIYVSAARSLIGSPGCRSR